MKWRPIKTAPQDGTFILVAEPHPGGTETPWLVIEARWIDVPQHGSVKPMPGWYAAYPAIYSGSLNSEWWVLKPVVCIRATHWMPLPKPPAMNPEKAKKVVEY